MKSRRYRVTLGGGLDSLRLISEELPEPVGKAATLRELGAYDVIDRHLVHDWALGFDL